MTSDETQIHVCGLVNVKCKRVAVNNTQNSEYHVVVAISRLWTDENCPAENTWPTQVKNEQSKK